MWRAAAAAARARSAPGPTWRAPRPPQLLEQVDQPRPGVQPVQRRRLRLAGAHAVAWPLPAHREAAARHGGGITRPGSSRLHTRQPLLPPRASAARPPSRPHRRAPPRVPARPPRPQQIVPSIVPGIVFGVLALVGFLAFTLWATISCCCACCAPCCRRCRRRPPPPPDAAAASQQFLAAGSAQVGAGGVPRRAAPMPWMDGWLAWQGCMCPPAAAAAAALESPRPSPAASARPRSPAALGLTGRPAAPSPTRATRVRSQARRTPTRGRAWRRASAAAAPAGKSGSGRPSSSPAWPRCAEPARAAHASCVVRAAVPWPAHRPARGRGRSHASHTPARPCSGPLFCLPSACLGASAPAACLCRNERTSGCLPVSQVGIAIWGLVASCRLTSHTVSDFWDIVAGVE